MSTHAPVTTYASPSRSDSPVVLGCGLLLDLDELRLVDEYRRELLQLVPRQIHQLLDALVGRRGQLRKQEAALLCVLADLLDRLTVIAQQVGLVGNNDLRTRCQKLAVAGKLGVDLLMSSIGSAALTACRVNQMQQQSAAINVAQEVVAQTGTLARALDNARNVGHDEVLLLTDRNHTEVGHQSREVVVCNLRARRRDHAQQRGLADIREADQTDIGQQLQLKDNIALDTRQTRLGKTRCLTRRRCKMRVAPAAVAALWLLQTARCRTYPS